jgi:hypothetical protein
MSSVSAMCLLLLGEANVRTPRDLPTSLGKQGVPFISDEEGNIDHARTL